MLVPSDRHEDLHDFRILKEGRTGLCHDVQFLLFFFFFLRHLAARADVNSNSGAVVRFGTMDDLHSSASDDSRSDAILTVTGTFLTISAVSVSLRCFVRTRLVRAFGWDDSLMVLAMSGSWFLSVCVVCLKFELTMLRTS